MSSPYSKIPGEEKIKVIPQVSQPITYLPYPNVYNRPSSSIQSTYTVPTGRHLNQSNRNAALPVPSPTNEPNGASKNIVLQVASIIFGLIGLIVQVVSIVFWRGMISDNVIPTPSFLEEIFFFVICFLKIALLILTINYGFAPTT